MELSKIQICAISLISILLFMLFPCQPEIAQARPFFYSQEAKPVQTEFQKQAAVLSTKAPNIDPKVLELALIAHKEAQEQGLISKPILTVIDYSKHSAQKRLWVFDLQREKLLMETHVTHGEKSGKAQATQFSNTHGSHQSSIGVFTTGETYRGAYGYSLRIDGREPGFNDQARRRAIVIHGAPYASESYAKRMGRLGLSWGCPAVDTRIAGKLIDIIKNGSMIFAYYPHSKWINSSSFLKN